MIMNSKLIIWNDILFILPAISTIKFIFQLICFPGLRILTGILQQLESLDQLTDKYRMYWHYVWS